ncbi:TPA: hypothetical protein ACH354_002212 [Clostridium perfringens]
MKKLPRVLKQTLIENFGTDCMLEVYYDRITMDHYELGKVVILKENNDYCLYLNNNLQLKTSNNEIIRGKIKELLSNLKDY